MTHPLITSLSPEDRTELLRQFRLAVMHRAAQWDAEREVEMLLDDEFDLDVQSFAAVVGDATLESVEQAVSDESILEYLSQQLSDD